ncbi:hypothetical protein G6F46_013410 [Rhizopus delemar]|uniref:Uncharacterized protein n=2 Tax=Rhizopus TaxID=4842 RepID=A0A9P6Y935_9FUNG|nr:hypothetical protein G6F55_013283 [Rhizopus delemar]KAG1531329.1 hypothetical protein G6F51_013557 [Rhizopus arrhizus]KAG1486564.1 hypothetical protein G6F54_013253 [Rhizopus delemar]KAG1490102.1 hypothetical protein G6F53_013305 [Rhizopus delemar]KAG1498311.1 hypothetical protein G6F52_012772 [Rhizopus delemar]
MSIYGVPEEHMHCFNVFDEIPDYEPMEVENINDLYQTTELEWHHWKGPNEDESVPEQAVKKLLDLKSYQELLDLVIEEGLSARKAGAIVGIVERTAQN